MFRRVLQTTIVLTAALAMADGAAAQSPADSAAIRAASLDYIEGWYAGDATRMDRALHPELAKRIVVHRDGHAEVRHLGASQLVAGAARGGGSNTPAAERRADVRILDIFRGTASVRVDAGGWVDFMHLAEVEGEWKIVNVLWQVREES